MKRIPAALGAVLFSLPIVAETCWPAPANHHPPRVPGPGYDYATAPRITSWHDSRITRRPGEPALAFAHRVTLALHDATHHCWPTTYAQSWLTWIVGESGGLGPEGLLDLHHFSCGFCSQRAFLLAVALRHGGIADARPYSLTGHVVVTFSIEGKRYADDVDLGIGSIRFPDSSSSIRAIVTAAYAPYARVLPDTFVRGIVRDYTTTGDDMAYSSYAEMRRIELAQQRWLSWEWPIDFFIAGVGALLSGISLLRSGLDPNMAFRAGGRLQ